MSQPFFTRPFPVKTITDDFNEHKARGSVNPGTDYGVKSGSVVGSCADGVVVLVKNTTSGAAGRVVIVDHGSGWSTEYLHLSKVLVKPGQVVKSGTPIGKSGASGFGKEHHYGAHVHVTLNKGGRKLAAAGNLDLEKVIKAQTTVKP